MTDPGYFDTGLTVTFTFFEFFEFLPDFNLYKL